MEYYSRRTTTTARHLELPVELQFCSYKLFPSEDSKRWRIHSLIHFDIYVYYFSFGVKLKSPFLFSWAMLAIQLFITMIIYQVWEPHSKLHVINNPRLTGKIDLLKSKFLALSLLQYRHGAGSFRCAVINNLWLLASVRGVILARMKCQVTKRDQW